MHGEAAGALPYLEDLAVLLSPLCVHDVDSLHTETGPEAFECKLLQERQLAARNMDCLGR